VQKTTFARTTKGFVAEMTALQKLFPRATRKELRQKQWCLSDFRLSMAWEKRLNTAWKRFESELLTAASHKRAFRALPGKVSKKIWVRKTKFIGSCPLWGLSPRLLKGSFEKI
jgi:hypothetical protein